MKIYIKINKKIAPKTQQKVKALCPPRASSKDFEAPSKT